MNCPGKKSHINAGMPPRLCYGSCAHYAYAAHLTGEPWMKPRIVEGVCVNHVQSIDGASRNSTHPQGGENK